jgi:D-alanyl-D-alanine carboxypeptidase (penicillin-binding protein 4)
VLADVAIPGYSGILVQTLDGQTVVENDSNLAFNPASNVKLATTFAVLKTFGPDYRFPTNVYTDGVIDKTTGTLTGNVYVSGRDPIFGFEHGVRLANELNRLGVRNVTGDLVVTDNFTMNYNGSALRSGQMLAAAMDSGKRSAGATRIWLNYLSNSGTYNQVQGIPGVTFTGPVSMQPIPSNLRLLFTHESAPLREIIKATLCYSNNFMAERLGEMVGGPYAVARIVQLNAGLQPSEFSLQTSSGLGINRVTPTSMMKLLRVLRSELSRNRMSFADIMPVAGIDKGTLESRFDTDFSRGSVVGKTGTLGQTDGGVSSLAGEINTRNGKLLFVVFNTRGSVARFRSFQNSYISLIQGQFGGPEQMNYNPISLDVRLARSRVTYPDFQTASN